MDRPPRRKPSGDFNLLTPEEVEAIARAAEIGFLPLGPEARKAHTAERIAALDDGRERFASQLGTIIRVAAQTGLRMGELRALRWADVRFAEGSVMVRRSAPGGGVEKAPKSGKVRSVPMTDDVIRLLDGLSLRDRFVGQGDLVFCSADGHYFDESKVRKAYKSAIRAAGLGHRLEQQGGRHPLTFHDLRHVFGSMAARSAQNLTDVQAWMGHASIQTTMIYVHHIRQPDAQKRLSAAWRGERSAVSVEA